MLVFSFIALLAFLLSIFAKLAYFQVLSLHSYLVNVFPRLEKVEDFKLLETLKEPLLSIGVKIITALPKVAFKLVLFIFTTYYFLVDWEKLKGWVERNLGKNYSKVMKKVEENLKAVVFGTIFSILVQIFYYFLVLSYFKTPNSLIFAIIAPVIGALPVIEPWVILLIPSAFHYFSGNKLASLLILLSTIPMSFADTFIKSRFPQGLHPLLFILSASSFIYFFGFAGFILGPIYATLVLSLLEE